MKRVMLIRHAKSGWDDLGADDFDRVLSARGEQDAPMMGERLARALAAEGNRLDAWLSSSAQRAAQTSKLLTAAIGFPEAQIDWRRELYLAAPDTLLTALQSLKPDVQCAALVAHNPGIAELVGQLIDQRVDQLPTCAIVTIDADIEDWRELRRGKLIDFDYPKRAHGAAR